MCIHQWHPLTCLQNCVQLISSPPNKAEEINILRSLSCEHSSRRSPCLQQTKRHRARFCPVQVTAGRVRVVGSHRRKGNSPSTLTSFPPCPCPPPGRGAGTSRLRCSIFCDLPEVLRLHFSYFVCVLQEKCSGHTKAADLFVQGSSRNECQHLLSLPVPGLNGLWRVEPGTNRQV